MVVCEEGNRWGFHLTRCSRSLLLRMNPSSPEKTPSVHILGPCSHHHECPFRNNKTHWCYFAQQCEAGPTAVFVRLRFED